MKIRTQDFFEPGSEMEKFGSGIQHNPPGSTRLGSSRVSTTHQESVPRTAAGQRVHVDGFRGPHSQMLTETSAQGGVNIIAQNIQHCKQGPVIFGCLIKLR
jgi:hypothetical protein